MIHSRLSVSQQALFIEPILAWCCPTVCDAGPTLSHMLAQWTVFASFAGYFQGVCGWLALSQRSAIVKQLFSPWCQIILIYIRDIVHETLIQCWVYVGQRRRRWSNDRLTLVQCLVFAGHSTPYITENTDVCPDVDMMLDQRRGRLPKIKSTLVRRRMTSPTDEFTISHSTLHIYPMFDQCWPTVYDVGPTLFKHRVSCFLGWLQCSTRSPRPGLYNNVYMYM